jgi:hypothetical protein
VAQLFAGGVRPFSMPHPTTKAKPASRQVHIVGYPVVRS